MPGFIGHSRFSAAQNGSQKTTPDHKRLAGRLADLPRLATFHAGAQVSRAEQLYIDLMALLEDIVAVSFVKRADRAR